MKTNTLIACLIFGAGLISAEKVAIRLPQLPQIPLPSDAPRAWLGLDLRKPDPSLTAHVPTLPPGIGFVVESIEEDGPAVGAGIQKTDLVWKLDDQLLVNEAQLAALLRLRKPGEEVMLAVIRSGQEMKIRMKLGEAPARQRQIADKAAELLLFPREAGPVRVVNVATKQASYSNKDGEAIVRREGDSYLVIIKDPQGALIFEGELAKDGGFAKVPDRWRSSVFALRRGLDHALEGRMSPQRLPRPRVVPPPAADS
jgi:hypothetical protein